MYICIYVHMYITWFCYIWRVVVLSFIPSTPKLVNFLHFLDSRSWEKNVSTPKLANFPFFGFQELRKNMCIYIYVCVYVNYFQPFPCILWVAQLPMGFHLAPKTPVDARNAMFSHQTFVLCSISAPDFCKTRDICIYIYIYACLFKPFSKKTLFSGAPLHFHILPSILVYANDSSFYISKCTLHIHIYICILIYYIIPSSSPKI
jgi:hypothetical protein